MDAVIAHIQSALSAYTYKENKNYAEFMAFPVDVDQFVSARFPGSARTRSEIGADPSENANLYNEDGAFRIDVFARLKPNASASPTNQDTQIAMTEAVVTAFMGKTISNVEIFRVATGLDLPAGVPPGWWGDSISCGFHYEHFGP